LRFTEFLAATHFALYGCCVASTEDCVEHLLLAIYHNSACITLAVDLLDNGLPAHAIASLGAGGANPTTVVEQRRDIGYRV
jgi:hypothetical protein